MARPRSRGALREEVAAGRLAVRSVKDEIRTNLIEALRTRRPLFPGIVGYDDTVIPQVVNALLSRHNFILLGLRGQAKTRLLRALTTLLDAESPVVAGCELHDDPLHPLCGACRTRLAVEGDDMAIDWLPRDARYVEKLATPDVTIADLIGDVDPIKAARSGRELGDELTMHYGLLPRANRGIFAINELPDLASKVQVGLFNILQEGDVQIKGYPVRLALDVLLVFSANPEDYTARGKIITPLKDRIGSEIRTHYPRTRDEAMAITAQEAWTNRGAASAPGTLPVTIPPFVREIVEQLAFHARGDQHVDRRSGVSQRLPITALENVVSNAERRAFLQGEAAVVPRVSDIVASLPSLTGKIELEYEGEMKGAETVARELVRQSVATVFDTAAASLNTRSIINWFNDGGEVNLSDTTPAATLLETLGKIPGVDDAIEALGAGPDAPEAARASAADFLLEGLCALRRLSRNDDGRLLGSSPSTRPGARAPRLDDLVDTDDPDEDLENSSPRGRKKKRYYN